MNDEPRDEMIDLRVTEKGFGLALYASTEPQGGGSSSSSCTLSSSLCCSFHLCV